MNKLWIPITAAMLLAGATAASERSGAGRHRGKVPADRVQNMAELLELSDAQRQQVQDLLEEQHRHRLAERDRVRAQQQELESLLDSGSADEARVGALVIQMHHQRQQLKADRQQTRDAINALLTPQQREKMELLEQMRSENREHRDHLRHERQRQSRPGDDQPD